MKKSLFKQVLISLLVVHSTMTNANDEADNTPTAFMAPLVEKSLLLDIAMADSIIVVGERGHILVSPANTVNFKQVAAPTNVTLTAVTSRGKMAWATGHDASIIKSVDAGESWQLVQYAPELDRPFLDIHFFNDELGIAVGAYGLFYRSEDGGNTWTQESHPSVLSEDDKAYLDSIKDDEAFYLEELSFISPHFNRLSEYKDKVYLAGEAGLVAVSEDKGRTWFRLDLDYQGSFFDVTQVSDDLLIAVGLRGNIFVNTNDEWQAVQSCFTTSLNAIVSKNDKIFITGNNGIVMALDLSKIFNTSSQIMNSEGCKASAGVSQITTDFSDAISNGLFVNGNMLAVTTAGIKTVKVED